MVASRRQKKVPKGARSTVAHHIWHDQRGELQGQVPKASTGLLTSAYGTAIAQLVGLKSSDLHGLQELAGNPPLAPKENSKQVATSSTPLLAGTDSGADTSEPKPLSHLLNRWNIIGIQWNCQVFSLFFHCFP